MRNAIAKIIMVLVLTSPIVGMEHPDKNQLLKDFDTALQNQDWDKAIQTVNKVGKIDKELAKNLSKEYNAVYDATKTSKREAFPQREVMQAAQSALIEGFNTALSSGDFSKAQTFLNKLRNANPETFKQLSQKLESAQAKMKIPVKPSPVPAFRSPQSPYAKPIPVPVKPGALVAVELVGCAEKAPFKYIVTVTKEDTNVYHQRITNTNKTVQYYPTNVPLTDAKNYWIKVSDEAGQQPYATYPTIKEYSIENGTIYAISTADRVIKTPLADINLKQDKIKLIINCTEGKPQVTIKKAQ